VNPYRRLLAATSLLFVSACAPRITHVEPTEGPPGTIVSLSMKYLVGWPRVDVAGGVLDWAELRLLGVAPESEGVRGEDLIWIEDKILQFRIPSAPPGDYIVTVYDGKGPAGQPVYSFLETAAYVAFPPVWPFVFRSNRAQTSLRILPQASAVLTSE
jgi:hypothetical protein